MAKLPYLAAAGSAIIFGFSFLFTKNALANLAVLQLLGLRFLLAAVFLALLRLLQIIKVEITAAKIKGLLLVAIFQPVLYFCFETVGVNLTAASLAGVIISLIPMVVALLAVIFLKEELSFLQWLSVLASVGGVVLVTLPSLKSGSGQLAGILALLGAVLCGALFNIYSKRASAVSSPVEVTYFMVWVG
ncbi:MAG TPA: DMT family transporter, partial [Firmicutes bacterium]|nr:DMT family transporter [Bacillota bacterium]